MHTDASPYSYKGFRTVTGEREDKSKQSFLVLYIFI